MAQKKSPKSSKQALQPQPDPRAPVDSKLLLQHLTRLMKTLEADLLARADGSKGLTEALKARHAHEMAAERTADAYDPWRRGVVTQVAAAWVLNLVFVRVLEDRGLVDQNRIAGPGAEGSQGEFLKLAPFLTERDYLLTVFRELSHFEVTRELFDPKCNLAFRITPSAEGAKALLQVFRQGGAEAPAFRFGQVDTRFLGDLYQDLSESVRKKYALLQTPDFIEGFILDRTLEPALESYGLDSTTLIDPTCGSGHFLLGAFERLFDRHLKERPNQNPRDAAQKALSAVFGTDINPYAVTIAKFRLMLAFLDKAGLTKLSSAPEVPLNVVVADSLFHQVAGEHPGQTDLGYRPGQKIRDWFDGAFALEEDEKAKAILGRGFAAVVGNPPYIQVKDKALNAAYRRRYRACHRSYSLAAPFVERFFQLCRPDAFTGMITANSFMKREFGKVLVQHVLAGVDVQLIVNTSGAYIPGHGTPTVLLFGQNRSPLRQTVRTVLAKRGEPCPPKRPAQGLVWAGIAGHWEQVGFENEYISVADAKRSVLAIHPWSLGGGGAAELKELLSARGTTTLGKLAQTGTGAVTREDDVYDLDASTLDRLGIPSKYRRDFVGGEHIRDWALVGVAEGLWPYNRATLEPDSSCSEVERFLWPWKAQLSGRVAFGKNQLERGLPWTAYSMFFAKRASAPLTITFAFVATHNHFVLERPGKVFNRTAPIIQLRHSATEDEHYALLAYLNSSTACFWMKQVFWPKGMNNGSKSNSTSFLVRYEFDGTKLKDLPLPAGLLTDMLLPRWAREMENLAKQRDSLMFEQVIAVERAADSLGSSVSRTVESRLMLLRRMIALQEEIDWRIYELFGLSRAMGNGPDELPQGGRPFEVALARGDGSEEERSWFKWNEYVSQEAFACSSHDLRAVLESRVVARGEVMGLDLLESPNAKRRWVQSAGKGAQELLTDERALRLQAQEWLVRRVEVAMKGKCNVFTEQEAVDRCISDPLLVATAEWLGHPADAAVMANVAGEAVPYASALRYAASGIEKHAAWLKTWELQRREDAGQSKDPIAVPPPYTAEDFKQPTYWSLRGKLDVPKERFISYPGCESDEDQSPVYGWAGWNHLERARALAALYDARKEDGWKPERLLPMLVGLLELLPWLKQYHNAPDEAVGGERPAEEFEAFIAGELRHAGKTPQEAEREVLAWAQARGAKSRSATAAKAVASRMDDGEPESGTRSSSPPDAIDDASVARSTKARLRKTRPRDTGANGERDTDEALELGGVSRPRAAAAGSASPQRRPPTSPASKRKKA
jgi:hypothetical protein